MSKNKKWNILNNFQFSILNLPAGRQGSQSNHNIQENIAEKLIEILLENRGITTDEEREKFLHPKLQDVTIESVGIDQKQLQNAIQRITQALENKEQIVIFGDYDVDGITGTAILWETLYSLEAKVTPFIPDRVEEGYGLSLKALKNSEFQKIKPQLIITVDNGIVANEAVAFANTQGIDVIITDHHARSEHDPDAFAIVHTTKLCGAGVGYLLSQEIQKSKNDPLSHLELVALATVADLVPLTGANRTLVTFGLEKLRDSKRPGLQALYQEAGIDDETIGVYEIGHIIAPRLNAMGRLASAMDSLRLICTKDRLRAQVLADKLGRTNRERQIITQEMAEHALGKLNSQKTIKSLLFVYDETYEQGVIGLIASKLVETYYRPAIVLSKGENHTKASARSISGFNIIEFIRTHSEFLVNAGGHPMAAGFTVETEKLLQLQEAMELLAQEQITEDLLVRSIKIDSELPLEIINQQLYDAIQTLAPFGMANGEPIFVSKNVVVKQIRAIGQEGKHLKLKISNKNSMELDAIAFTMGELIADIDVNDTIDIAYTIDENIWNGRKNLQLKIKDIKMK